MTDLKTSIMKAAEFKTIADEYAKVIDENVFYYDVRFVQAAALENARLLPLIELLAECVQKAIDHDCQMGEFVFGDNNEALAALKELVGKK